MMYIRGSHFTSNCRRLVENQQHVTRTNKTTMQGEKRKAEEEADHVPGTKRVRSTEHTEGMQNPRN